MVEPAAKEVLELAVLAARKAGTFITEVRESGDLNVSFKAEHNIVTAADVGAEKIILETIRSHFPDHVFLTEEGNPELSSPGDWHKPLWIVDPVDGTTNYAHGHAHVGVSIAFALGGVVQVGVVLSPFQNELFTAIRGEGAYVNGERLQCTNTMELKDALVTTGFPYEREDRAALMVRLTKVLENCRDVRRLGAASLDACWVGAGRLDVYYETVMPWDIAAGGLVAREAGALTGHLHSIPEDCPLPSDLYSKEFVVATPGIFSKFLELLR